jgi:AsmA protein
MWIVLGLLLLAALVPPWINVSRYRQRVAQAISRALGREVTVSGIGMQLLPRPGIVLHGFVVADDPAFGAEPMLRAETVTADPRLTSLWRGRLEIGTLELENPSLNLVRRPDGHWNVEALFQRTTEVSSAPTATSRPENRARFPYIEATAGRINFKLGQVKKAFSFTETDFALWRESETEWGIRLTGKPMRTDLALSDTGQLSLEGRFQNAAQLRDTPLRIKVEFTKGQLGQITKLIYGRDRGWRGATSASATLSGTPASLGVVLDGQVDDFRRYDIALGEALRLRVHCVGSYAAVTDELNDVGCEAPVKPGTLRLSGWVRNWGVDSYQLAITAQQLPLDRLVAFARHAKKDLPADLSATGESEAAFEVRKAPNGVTTWSGGGSTRQMKLHSKVLAEDLELGDIEFAVPGTQASPAARRRRAKRPGAHTSASPGFILVFHPFAFPLGAPSPATASGFLDEENYRATLSGEGEMANLLQVTRALGISTPAVGLQGKAEVELEITGPWAGFTPPTVSGQVQVRDGIAELPGINEPLGVQSAAANISAGVVNVAALSSSFANGPTIGGTASFPLQCTASENCVIHFNLHANALSLNRVNQLLNPSARSQPWYHLLGLGQQRRDALLTTRADGSFTVARFELGPLLAGNVAGQLKMNDGSVELDILRSDVLGGHYNGPWTADFAQSPPRFAGGGALQKIAMDQLAAVMHDNWAAGQLTGKFGVALQGTDAASLRDSATGSMDFAWTGGTLRHIVLEGHATPMSFSSLAGVVQFGKPGLTLKDCTMNSGGTAYELNGTAAYDRTLKLKLERPDGISYTISGQLEKPQVQALPATQARLQ